VETGIAFNPGRSAEIVTEIRQRAEREFLYGGRRITVISHSLGGLRARSVARRRPHAIARLIMLGVPLTFATGLEPASVAITSIYVWMDLPYQPRARASHADNLQVKGSHDGSEVNRRVYARVAELLRRPDSSP